MMAFNEYTSISSCGGGKYIWKIAYVWNNYGMAADMKSPAVCLSGLNITSIKLSTVYFNTKYFDTFYEVLGYLIWSHYTILK